MANRARFSIGCALLCSATWAQNATISSVLISTEPAGARFYVDGQAYGAPQTFLWPQGSKHTVQFPVALNPDGSSTGCQVSRDLLTKYCSSGWSDSTGNLASAAASDQTVTATPSLTWLKARLTLQHRVALRFIDLPAGALPVDCTGGPGNAPQDFLRTGVVYIGGSCYGSSADLWLPSGAQVLNAFPFPGFVFKGWNVNGATYDSYVKSVVIDRPGTVLAEFLPAKRVQFLTNPPGMKLLIDRTIAPTTATEVNDDLSPNYSPCKQPLNLPPQPPITIPALCFGEFDFLPGSRHVLAANSPQLGAAGKWWVFDKFSNGLEQNAVYTADSNTSARDVITANFAPGAQAAFLTNPGGLKLNIDGRENWPGYTFIWAANSKHRIVAPASQVDSNGRRWTFQGWSNGGGAAQDVIADADGAGMRLTAVYAGLGQVKVLTNPPGIALMLDGIECSTPCSVDRPAGTEVSIAPPALVPIDEGSRLDFAGWSDGASLVRTLKVPAEPTTIFANYNRSYRLLVTADPAGGVDVATDPPSTDSFYPADSVVAVTAEPRAGFKFRRWGGDLVGVYRSAQIALASPRAVVASLDRVPYIAPAGIRNAAGETPEKTVAPGSIISIHGESLAPRSETGPRNPLAQTLADVVVMVNDRILPLLFVSPRQINAQILSDLPDGEYALRVRWTGKPDVSGTFTLSRNSPGLFAQAGESETRYSLAIHEDATPITPDSPARRGELITVYGTGFGPFNQKIIDGFVFPESSSFDMVDVVEITAGAFALRPEWSGGAAGFAGMTATRFRISGDIPSSRVDLSVRINGKLSNTVVLPVE